MDYLYIDTDEDHVALQFYEKKSDIVKAENGVKNNGRLAKLVNIYEGKKRILPEKTQSFNKPSLFLQRKQQGGKLYILGQGL